MQVNLTQLRSAAVVLSDFLTEFKGTHAELRRGGLNPALEAWTMTTEDYDALDDIRKGLNELLTEMSRVTLPEMMAEHQTKTISLDSVKKRFTVAQRINCSMLDKELGFEWLKANGQGALITPTVNAQTLGSFAKQYTQEEGKELPDNIFKVSSMSYMSATKIK